MNKPNPKLDEVVDKENVDQVIISRPLEEILKSKTALNTYGKKWYSVETIAEICHEYTASLQAELENKCNAFDKALASYEASHEVNVRLRAEVERLKGQLGMIKAELALSTSTDDEKPIVTIRRIETVIKELRAENAALKTKLYESNQSHGKTLLMCEKTIAALKADKERLDWLELHIGDKQNKDGSFVFRDSPTGVRGAIDEAKGITK